MTTVNSAFIESIDVRFNATACMNCGVCTALCPLEIVPLPRMLFRQVMLGLEDKIIENEDTIYTCLLCKMCEANCPAAVPIAENIRLLRNHLNITLYGLGR
jgi:heterodisulfide reductase subunit C